MQASKHFFFERKELPRFAVRSALLSLQPPSNKMFYPQINTDYHGLRQSRLLAPALPQADSCNLR
jgi:hypothetical protein